MFIESRERRGKMKNWISSTMLFIFHKSHDSPLIISVCFFGCWWQFLFGCRLAGSFILHVFRPPLFRNTSQQSARLHAKKRWKFSCFHFFTRLKKRQNEKKEIYRQSVTVKQTIYGTRSNSRDEECCSNNLSLVHRQMFRLKKVPKQTLFVCHERRTTKLNLWNQPPHARIASNIYWRFFSTRSFFFHSVCWWFETGTSDG